MIKFNTMNFTSKDVQRLYGKKLFLIEEEETKSLEATISVWDSDGESATWYMKPNAKLALILSQSEFRNKSLTQQLKTCVQEAKIPPEEVGFGMLPDQPKGINLGDIPTGKGLLFWVDDADQIQESAQNEKSVFLVPKLQEIISFPAGRAQLIAVLKQSYKG